MKRLTLFPLAVAGLVACQDATQPNEAGTLETPAFGIASVPSGIVSWWPGDLHAHDIVGSNHGTLFGDATFGPGKVKDAFSLDGALGDSIEVPDDASLDISGQITIDAWINPNSLNPYEFGPTARIVDKITGGANDGYLLDIIDSRLRLIASPEKVSGTTAIPLHTWTHVAGTYDGMDIKVYVNGALDGTAPKTGSIPTNNLSLLIGEAHPVGAFAVRFDGLIDEVEIFNRALSAGEIQAIFDAGKAGKRKPQVCVSHNGNTISVAASALQAHLAHGDVQVECSD